MYSCINEKLSLRYCNCGMNNYYQETQQGFKNETKIKISSPFGLFSIVHSEDK